VFSLEDGHIEEIVSIDPTTAVIDDVYRYDDLEAD
jgi:hypothetical protein